MANRLSHKSATQFSSPKTDELRETAPQKFVAVLMVIARFALPIQIFVFLVLASGLTTWLAAPIAHAVSAFLVCLPSYWLISKPKVSYAIYVAFCALLAVVLALLEHLLLG